MSQTKLKPPCKFGAKCYRKNPKHFEEYSHPKERPDDDKEEEEPPTKKPKIALDDTAEDKETTVCPSTSGDDGGASGYTRPDDNESEDVNDDSSCVTPPPSPADIRENIKSKFLVEMPEDFYNFWEFAKSLNAKKPRDCLQLVGLQLVGPYDVLAGAKANKTTCWLRHWRYYYDPPEFLTVLRGDDRSQFHMGYYRDDPEEMPVFVASNAAAENCTITPHGSNIFAAVNWYIDNYMKKEKNYDKSKVTSLQQSLSEWAKKHGYSLESQTKEMKARQKKVVCATFHRAGLVVPVDANDVGYRELPETDADLKKIFKRIKESTTEKDRDHHMDALMEIVTLVQFANDECDYGEGLELGIDLFSYGGDCFHGLILKLLPLAYQLLRRLPYGEIIKAHLKDRRHSAQLSQL